MDPCDFLTQLTRFVKIIPLETLFIQQTVIGKQREAGLTPSLLTSRLQSMKKRKSYGLFTLSDTENENEVYTDADNMWNTSHCTDSDSNTDCDKMQNSLLTCPK